ASEIFSELTLGSLSGLKEDYNDKGEQILVASRPDGTLLNAAALSEGTRDQLYLSLRLASLENYLIHHEAIPFIADDLLVNFDNERAVATIKILQSLSNRTQVIFFTHHAHILELIKTRLDESGIYIHRLADASIQLSVATA
ncbi:MAG: hypothetical protein K2X81_19175, partial [Candidatus Obscuribacterales bacterium]|nr:hypothetical protein [Candidatus Obscuribacterales bacterium]